MLHTGPIFFSDALLKSLLVLISTQANDADVLPVAKGGMFLQHFLVVGHRLLTWGAPGSPEVKKDYLAGLVLDRRGIIASDEADVFNQAHF